MYYPIGFTAKIFRRYLKVKDHPGKIRIQNWIGRNLFTKGIRFRDKTGILLQLNANDWITRIMLMDGGYEKDSVLLAKKIMQKGGVLIDIGANFGLYSCSIGANNKKTKIVAVDANYKIIPALLFNMSLNNLGEAMVVFNTAISDKRGFVSLEQQAADNMGTTYTKKGDVGLINVACCSLGELFDINGITSVMLIKIDIEGHEFAVFKDVDFTKYNVENILLEFNHLSPVTFPELKESFQKKGFSLFTIFGMPLTNAEEEIPENNIWIRKNGH